MLAKDPTRTRPPPGAMLPLCVKGDVNNKRAAIACGVAMATLVLFVLVFVVIIPLSLDW